MEKYVRSLNIRNITAYRKNRVFAVFSYFRKTLAEITILVLTTSVKQDAVEKLNKQLSIRYFSARLLRDPFNVHA